MNRLFTTFSCFSVSTGTVAFNSSSPRPSIITRLRQIQRGGCFVFFLLKQTCYNFFFFFFWVWKPSFSDAGSVNLTYSQSDCYNVCDPSTVHICAKCSVKSRTPCTSSRTLDRFIRSEKSKSDRKAWVFELMRMSVMNSILNEEFKCVQSRRAEDKSFLRLFFSFIGIICK